VRINQAVQDRTWPYRPYSLDGPWSTLTQPKVTYDHPSKRKVKEKLPELAPMDQTVEQEEKEVQDRLAQL